MQSIITAMAQVRETLFSALLRSIWRTKSILRTILRFWISPSVLDTERTTKTPAAEDHIRVGYSGSKSQNAVSKFLHHVETEILDRIDDASLMRFSDGLLDQMKRSLVDNEQCMLPSFNHQLPTGEEHGTYLALDVGGSTFRVGLIKLFGKEKKHSRSEIVSIQAFKIDRPVKQLEGVLFFDWMAQRIEESLSDKVDGHVPGAPLSTGLAWSFPIEQTSLRSGRLQSMGKGFMAAHGLLGRDLADVIQDACSRQGLNIKLNAIVNDSSATLLSKAYHDSTTKFGLILGTGVNAAVHLPVHMFSPAKFGTRPAEWHNDAKHVIVNTELSMFGGGILPLSIWDEDLNNHHSMPDFQPLEHFVSGGYLGEVVRLILVHGIQTAGLFGGSVPESLKQRYSLDSETVSRMEADTTSSLATATKVFYAKHPTTTPPTYTDISALCCIASCVSTRATAVLATGVHALWRLRNEAEGISATDSKHAVVAYNGSVLENYPRFQARCQTQLDSLAAQSGALPSGILELEHAEESSLLGAAVAVACIKE